MLVMFMLYLVYYGFVQVIRPRIPDNRKMYNRKRVYFYMVRTLAIERPVFCFSVIPATYCVCIKLLRMIKKLYVVVCNI